MLRMAICSTVVGLTLSATASAEEFNDSKAISVYMANRFAGIFDAYCRDHQLKADYLGHKIPDRRVILSNPTDDNLRWVISEQPHWRTEGFRKALGFRSRIFCETVEMWLTSERGPATVADCSIEGVVLYINCDTPAATLTREAGSAEAFFKKFFSTVDEYIQDEVKEREFVKSLFDSYKEPRERN